MTSDGFLSRWSRRKREIVEAEAKAEVPEAPLPAAPSDESAEPDPETAEAIAALPPIESLTAETDLGQFLRAGVPRALRNAALRRMWSLDPGIRDYLCEAREYAYDWNVVGGVPGQGPLLPTDDVEAMLRQVFAGTDAVKEAGPEPVPEGGADTAEPAETPATEGVAPPMLPLPSPDEVPGSSEISSEGSREHLANARQVERRSPLPGEEGQGEERALFGDSTPLGPREREPVAAAAQGTAAIRQPVATQAAEREPARVRRHGGAVPI